MVCTLPCRQFLSVKQGIRANSREQTVLPAEGQIEEPVADRVRIAERIGLPLESRIRQCEIKPRYDSRAAESNLDSPCCWHVSERSRHARTTGRQRPSASRPLLSAVVAGVLSVATKTNSQWKSPCGGLAMNLPLRNRD